MPGLSERQRTLLRCVRTEPWSSTAEAAAYAGITEAVARESLRRLAERQLIVERRDCWASSKVAQ